MLLEVCLIYISLKGNIMVKSATILYEPICLVGDSLDMPLSIYDAIKVIKHVSAVFFWANILPTHYQGAVLLTKCLIVYICICKQ